MTSTHLPDDVAPEKAHQWRDGEIYRGEWYGCDTYLHILNRFALYGAAARFRIVILVMPVDAWEIKQKYRNDPNVADSPVGGCEMVTDLQLGSDFKNWRRMRLVEDVT